jgi:drug/metabolite transporter (DMT)-like permease
VSRITYLDGMTPLGFTLWKAALATFTVAAILTITALRGRRRLVWRAVPARAGYALAAAGVALVVSNLAIFTAFQRLPIAVALLCLFTYPAITAAGAVILGEEALGVRRGTALALSLTGMAIAVAGGGIGAGSGLSLDAVGVALALVASAAQGAYVLLGRRGFSSVPSEEAALVVLAVQSFSFGCFVLAAGGAAGALPLERPTLLPALIWTGVGTGIATLLFLVAVRAIGPTRTSILALIEPVAGVGLAAIFLGEAVTPVQAGGGVLVLFAAALLRRGEAAEPSAAGSSSPR